MTVEVKLFAVAKQLAGAESVALELSAAPTIHELRVALAARHPALKAVLSHVVFAVNAEYVDDQFVIPPRAEVACIPPVSGG